MLSMPASTSLQLDIYDLRKILRHFPRLSTDPDFYVRYQHFIHFLKIYFFNNHFAARLHWQVNRPNNQNNIAVQRFHRAS